LVNNENTITVFEHQILRTDRGEKCLTEDQLKALQSYYGNGVPYFSLVHHGVQFNEYVGVLQIGKTLIEVLPKADKFVGEKDTWRTMLIDMLRTVNGFEIKATSNANLKTKPNTVLDLYFELFVKEVEYLLHSGLVKKYRKKEGNNNALKGNLLFAKNIQKNVTHQERFFTRFTTYDVVHPLNQILYKTIQLLKKINTSSAPNSRLGALMLNFPEMPDIKISETLFNKIILNRKTQIYKRALDIAKMILLQYHPDLSRGKNDVLALMFDMNVLWEQFVYISLKKHNSDRNLITAQTTKHFWKPSGGRRSSMKPDIVINKLNGETLVLDTKWKNLNGYNPSPDDLRQLYVYHQFYDAEKVALVYPGNSEIKKGTYFKGDGSDSAQECSIITLPVAKNIKDWQIEICAQIKEWGS
jgi:5-methylcytosine-specific restriction enzyme subunit McrC